jgi:hypothetical protein
MKLLEDLLAIAPKNPNAIASGAANASKNITTKNET